MRRPPRILRAVWKNMIYGGHIYILKNARLSEASITRNPRLTKSAMLSRVRLRKEDVVKTVCRRGRKGEMGN